MLSISHVIPSHGQALTQQPSKWPQCGIGQPLDPYWRPRDAHGRPERLSEHAEEQDRRHPTPAQPPGLCEAEESNEEVFCIQCRLEFLTVLRRLAAFNPEVVRRTRRDAHFLASSHDMLLAGDAKAKRTTMHCEPIGLVRVHMLWLTLRTGRAHTLKNEPRAGGRIRGFDEPDALSGAGVQDFLSDLCHSAITSYEL
ncbi:MAG: hypothetical protein KatS3mg054_1012 [Chloroflexus sp.]|nr:MAG: hypothetical protein KatS3mg054_1012 [Chloroflexus sp.]